jgi:hypothetical protein
MLGHALWMPGCIPKLEYTEVKQDLNVNLAALTEPLKVLRQVCSNFALAEVHPFLRPLNERYRA